MVKLRFRAKDVKKISDGLKCVMDDKRITCCFDNVFQAFRFYLKMHIPFIEWVEKPYHGDIL